MLKTATYPFAVPSSPAPAAHKPASPAIAAAAHPVTHTAPAPAAKPAAPVTPTAAPLKPAAVPGAPAEPAKGKLAILAHVQRAHAALDDLTNAVNATL
jgi:hypothetical protein